MINKQKKPTNKDMIRALATMATALEALQYHVQQGDKALDEYIKMNNDKEKFIKYLQDKVEDVKDSKKTKDK